jgi:hypothetical protein
MFHQGHAYPLHPYQRTLHDSRMQGVSGRLSGGAARRAGRAMGFLHPAIATLHDSRLQGVFWHLSRLCPIYAGIFREL